MVQFFMALFIHTYKWWEADAVQKKNENWAHAQH